MSSDGPGGNLSMCTETAYITLSAPNTLPPPPFLTAKSQFYADLGFRTDIRCRRPPFKTFLLPLFFRNAPGMPVCPSARIRAPPWSLSTGLTPSR
jgi:hypothetical protein